MTKIDIYSGFLGAGKTTLIKKMIQEAYQGEKLVLIENEFGEIGIDGGFLREAGIEISEMNSGCICCSLVGDFGEALKKVIHEYHPDRILIEPSGVGKLSDVVSAVRNAVEHEVELCGLVTVADAKKCKMYMKNFGEFYNNQVATAKTIILSRTDAMDPAKVQNVVDLLREVNPSVNIITTPWEQISGAQIMSAMEEKNTLAEELHQMEAHEHHHHEEECHCHEHHHHDEDCHCHEHHHHDEECHCHEHHHHDEDCHCHERHHHDEECHCHGHHHDHDGHGHEHHHHHADDVFSSWGRETTKVFTEEEIRGILHHFSHEDECGMILRAKGIVAAEGQWIHFDYVPGEMEIRRGSAEVTGRLCVIGSGLHEEKIATLFGV